MKPLYDAAKAVVDAWGKGGFAALATAMASLSEQTANTGFADPDLRQLAVDRYAVGSDDDVEFDDEPAISKCGDGTWVQAWVWVPNAEAES